MIIQTNASRPISKYRQLAVQILLAIAYDTKLARQLQNELTC